MFLIKPNNALISVYNKAGLEELCRCFAAHDIVIYATGKTMDFLRSSGISAKPVSEMTGFSELLSGRIKTLHPAVFASILAIRGNSEHLKQLEKMGIPLFDIVVSNLYPFEQTLAEGGQTETELMEMVDIGGVALTRAAAKNHKDVAIITDIGQYGRLIEEMESGSGQLSEGYLKQLAAQAFERTASYDYTIASSLLENGGQFGESLVIRARKKMDLRYGENPFQAAAVYRSSDEGGLSVLDATNIGNKELSFNNILDLNIALEMAVSFEQPCAIIVKHANPSAVAAAPELSTAVQEAYESDALSAYGCIIGLNREMDEKCAHLLSGKFVDAIIAPSYSRSALETLTMRKKLRLLSLEGMKERQVTHDLDVRRVMGGYLAQTTQVPDLKREQLKVVSKRKPTEQEVESLMFGWKVVRFLWSNAIVLSKGSRTVGVGAGQSSRVDAVRIAVQKSRGASKGSVMASDAFFPFRDGIDEAANGGVTAVMQPGGSIRDSEVIEAADEHRMAMLFTGQRLFRH